MKIPLTIFIFIISITSIAFGDSCSTQWDHWYQNYTSGSPFAAQNKNTPWQITREYLDGALSGNPVVKFSHNEKIDGEPAAPFVLGSVQLMPPEELVRRPKVLGHMTNLIDETQKDTLLVIFVGASHGYDFYLNHLKTPVTYVFSKLDDDTSDWSHHAEDYFAVAEPNIIHHKGNPHYGDTSALFIIDALDQLYSHVLKKDLGQVTSGDLLLGTPPNLSKIVYADYHMADSTSVIDNFPEGKCVAGNYKKVVFAVEHLPSNKISLDEMFNFWQDRLFGSVYLPSSKKVRKRFPELYKKVRSGEISLWPEAVAWYYKLSEISKFVPVEIRNLE